jgi:hypothetical protein
MNSYYLLRTITVHSDDTGFPFKTVMHPYNPCISAKLDTDIVLHCPYQSTVTHPIIWYGPITSSGYTHNEKINKNISIHERLSLTSDNNTGEYNLNIHHLTRKDQGLSELVIGPYHIIGWVTVDW